MVELDEVFRREAGRCTATLIRVLGDIDLAEEAVDRTDVESHPGAIGKLEGFAQLIAIGAPKPFECVGEEQEGIAALRLLAADERWRSHVVVRRLAGALPAGAGDPREVLALSGDHELPPSLDAEVRAVLGA